MKNLILTAFISLLTTHAVADSATFKVAKFKGELVLEPGDVKVESMVLRARIQHCNFWGTSCAGGPSENSDKPVAFTFNTRTNLLGFDAQAVSLQSRHPGNRFSSCKLSISLYGRNSRNEKVEGYVGLIHENDKKTCESSAQINEQIAEIFKVPQKVRFFGVR